MIIGITVVVVAACETRESRRATGGLTLGYSGLPPGCVGRCS